MVSFENDIFCQSPCSLASRIEEDVLKRGWHLHLARVSRMLERKSKLRYLCNLYFDELWERDRECTKEVTYIIILLYLMCRLQQILSDQEDKLLELREPFKKKASQSQKSPSLLRRSVLRKVVGRLGVEVTVGGLSTEDVEENEGEGRRR
jgi:hypothetical protein